MKFVALVLVLASASLALGSKIGLLVGVDQYAFIPEPTRQLHGAETDTGLVKRMLGLYGFQSNVLLRADATRKRIIEELQKALDSAKSGDEVVFYFSGRGAIAPSVENPTSKTGYEPTLVPFDGSAKSLDPDIRMKRIEDWAKALDAKGAHVTLILDTCFENPARSDFGRQYNPIPRCAPRPMTADGEVRDQIYMGPGLFLSACPAKGEAYEWLINATEDRWVGAFTDQFVNATVAMLNRGEQPTALDAMREVQAYFKDKVRADYMPGLAPFPPMEVLMGGGYDKPILGGLDVKTLPPDSKTAIAVMDQTRVDREKKFRVAIELPDEASEPARRTTYDKVSKDLSDYLKTRVPNSEFAPAGSPPDVIVRLKVSKDKVEASVTGDDLDKSKVNSFQGKDLRQALSSGLGQFLELRGLVAKLYRLTATQTPTWDTTLKVTTDDVAYNRGDTFGIDIAADTGALLFILDRDDADGILQLAFPQPGAPFSQKLAGPLRMGGQLEKDTSSGRFMLRAIVIPSTGRRKIPEVSMKDETKFRDLLLAQLRIVVDSIEKNQLPWTSKTINLRIR